jgi:ABC-type phosphate transport system substrate-binding protein
MNPARGVAMVLAALVIGAAAPHVAVAQEAIAVIANRSNPIDSVTAADLQRLYMGAATVFPNRERVVLFEQAGLRESFYRTVLNMSADRVKRHWIGIVFAGSSATPPKSVTDAKDVRNFVKYRRGAIAFVDARAVDSSVKVLAVDGFLPGDRDYALWGLDSQ